MAAALLFSGLLLGCGVTACPVVAPAADSAVVSMIAHSVQLHTGGGTCSGIRIGGGLVVTAKHCVTDAKLGDTYSTDYVLGYVSPDHDFAVLSGDKEISPVALVDAHIGEHLYVVGWPVQLDDGKTQLTVTDGIFTGTISEDMERITAQVYYGNSGGGVWSDEGDLLGVAVEIRPVVIDGYPPLPFPGYAFMVPVQYVRALVL